MSAARAAIAVLPRAAAERIAAGEVVERPASVVKELVENSLDAGARRVTVEIEGAGGRLVRVTDDGEGIVPEELAAAFERFATSKIRSAEDLAGVRTYGFRGEALPSIAAIARVDVVSRAAGRDAAARIAVAGGVRADVGPAAGPPGTTVTVEDLFFNTPARSKFLRSPARETAVIVETLESLALAAPEVAFRLVDGGREVLWAPAEPFEARARRLLGPELAARTLEVSGTGRLVRLRGVVGTPQAAQRRRTHQWFLVNRRPVRSPLLARALATAFHTLIPDDRYAVAVLSLCVAPAGVDVNVHPRKTEVRFVRDGEVFDDVVRELRRALREASLLHVVGGGRSGEAEALLRRDTHAAETPPGAAERALPDPAPAPAGLAEPRTLWPSAPGWPQIRLIGQLALTYLVGEADGDLVLIDQHAAHERVLYERLLERREAAGADAQGLVVPVVLELTRAEHVLLAELDAPLRALGFETEPFGPAAVRLTAVPAAAVGRAPDALLRACLHDLRAGGPHAGRDLAERLAIATACHTAIRSGDRLDPAEMGALVADLARTRDPFSCFHGRPTMVRVRDGDLERWFYRRP